MFFKDCRIRRNGMIEADKRRPINLTLALISFLPRPQPPLKFASPCRPDLRGKSGCSLIKILLELLGIILA